MKKTMLSMFLFTLALGSFSQSWIRSNDAGQFRGDVLNVLGMVSEIHDVQGRRQAGKYIKLASREPGTSLTLIILKEDLPKFESITRDLLHQYVHVKGKIVKKKGRTYIMLSSPAQISIAREMEILSHEPQ